MRNNSNKHLGWEIDQDLHQTMKYIAAYEGRSLNRQAVYLLRQCVAEFEQKHGPVKDATES